MSPPARFLPPDDRFSHVHLDLVGPLPPCDNCSYILTCVDRFTRWPEAVPIKDCSAETTAAAFVSTWVSRYGVPAVITTDRGSNFESALFHRLVTLLGTCRTRTTAYHPQTNDVVERFHRHLKSVLRANRHPQNWATILPVALLGIRSALREDLHCSSAELVFGTQLRLPGEFFAPTTSSSSDAPASYLARLRDVFSTLRPLRFDTRVSQPCRPPYQSSDLSTCTHVYIRICRTRKPLEAPYEGPFRVISRTAKHFTIEIRGKEDRIAVDRLKPAYFVHAPEPTSAVIEVSLLSDDRCSSGHSGSRRQIHFASP